MQPRLQARSDLNFGANAYVSILQSPVLLLRDGRLLLLISTLPRYSNVPGTAAMLWDPNSDAWAPAGNPVGASTVISLLPLPDATVLAVKQDRMVGPAFGRFTNASPSLRYDPANDTWTKLAGAPVFPDGRESDTVLGDGTVLILGRLSAGALQPSAFLYSPADNTFTPLPAPRSVRQVEEALTLPDGRVLITGEGFGPGIASEVFDPATRSWGSRAATIEPVDPRSAVVLADGSVLMAGGYDDFSTRSVILRPVP